MSDYVALFAPGHDVTMTAQSAIKAGMLVKVVGDRAVAPATAASDAWMGVATMDAAVGAQVGVTSGGVQELVAAGVIAAGAAVVAGAAGTAAAGATPTAPGYVGTALTGATNGAKTLVKFAR